VQVAVFRLVVAGRGLDVLDFVLAGQDDVIGRLDPGALLVGRIGEVDPDGRHVLQIGARRDRNLIQSAIL
jgi:hypothetical protein